MPLALAHLPLVPRADLCQRPPPGCKNIDDICLKPSMHLQTAYLPGYSAMTCPFLMILAIFLERTLPG